MNEEKKRSINEEAYTNYAIYTRLDTYITAREEKDEELTRRLDEIIKAQKYTNGNVMDLLLWRAYTKGQVFIIPLIVGAVVSGVVALLFKQF